MQPLREPCAFFYYRGSKGSRWCRQSGLSKFSTRRASPMSTLSRAMSNLEFSYDKKEGGVKARRSGRFDFSMKITVKIISME